jgi:hypothetical protein
VILPRTDGGLSDFVLGVVEYVCPKGHSASTGIQIEFDFDALSIPAFRSALSEFLRAFDESCPRCGRSARADAVRRAQFFYPFEDLAGTVVLEWTADSGAFGVGYSPEVRPDRLLAAGAPALRDLVRTVHSDLRNDDCRAALGRVFSIRSRWHELLERFAQAQKTLVESVAPGLAIGLHVAARAAEFRAILRVLLPDYDPLDRHLHVPLLPDARAWLDADAVRRIEEYRVAPIAVVDRWEAYGVYCRQAERLGVRLDDYRLRNADGLAIEVAFDDGLLRAARAGRTLGEQAYIDLAPAAAMLDRAHRIVEWARARGSAEVQPDWTLRFAGRSHDLARLAEQWDPEAPGAAERLASLLGAR